jgi:hypothetical protein
VQRFRWCAWSIGPRWDFRETVEKTVAWYRRFLEGADPLGLTKAQIREYMESMERSG